MEIFEFRSWESYFAAVLKAKAGDRGYKTRLANAAKVHPSYISRILDGDATVSPDQAAALGEFWGLDTAEKQYLLWLVMKARAATPELARLAEDQLASLRREQEELGNHLEAEKISADDHTEYYLDWIYSAVHMLGTLREPLTLDQIGRRLGVKEAQAFRAVEVLTRMGLVSLVRGKVVSTKKNIHLSNQAWIASLQHRNWRLACAERIEVGAEGAQVHYTGVHSLSKADYERLKRMIRDFLVQADRLIRPSAEETACFLCVDLAEL